MATKVKVHTTGVVACEVSGGEMDEYGAGDHEFTVGVSGSMIQFLTIRRINDVQVRVTPLTGNVVVELEGKKGKPLKKGKELAIKVKRALVKEPA